LISLTPSPMLRSPSAALTRLGKTPPTAPTVMPAPVACMNDRRDHLPCRTQLAPSYVMSVSSEVIGRFFGFGTAASPSLWALRMNRAYYSAGVRPTIKDRLCGGCLGKRQ